MTTRFGYIMFAAFFVAFILLTFISIAQSNPIAVLGGATLTYLAGESMTRCRQS